MSEVDSLTSSIRQMKSCGICKRECRNPKSLDCFHNFCLNCLKQHLHDSSVGNDSFSCPVCKLKIISKTGSNVDNLFLESLKSNSLFGDDREMALVNLGFLSCKTHPNYSCHNFYRDRLELACDVCKMNQPEFCEELTSEAIKKIVDKKYEKIDKSILATKQDLAETCDVLNSTIRQTLTKNDDTVLGILKYFADLKAQIIQYLTNHEKEILRKLDNLTSTEMAAVTRSSSHCLSLMESINSKFSFLNKPIQRQQEDTLSYYIALDTCQTHIDEYTYMTRTLKQDACDQTDIRFIINTELEDMLTGSDLIDIELINSRTRSSAEANSEARVSTIRGQIDNMSNSSPISDAHSSSNSEEIVITVSPPTEQKCSDFPEEPPPPYPGITQNGINENNREISFKQSAYGVPNIPTAPSFENLFIPVVPRGMTHGVVQEPISPPGNPADDNRLRFQPIKKFKISCPNYDEHTPSIGEVCWIDENQLVTLDRRNNSLKVFNDRGRCLNVHKFTRRDPYGCTVYKLLDTPSTSIAVCFPKIKALSIFSIKQSNAFDIEFEHDVCTVKGYTCVTFSEKFVNFFCATTSPFYYPSVDILDKEGRILKSFTGSDAVRLGYPRSLRVNGDGIIAISDYKHCRVLCMDIEGMHQCIFDGSDTRNLTDPQGIGVYEKLSLFVVADTRKNRIYCIDSRGTIYDEISQNTLNEKTPRFIDFSPSSNPTLAVGYGNGFISLYNVIDTISCPDFIITSV